MIHADVWLSKDVWFYLNEFMQQRKDIVLLKLKNITGLVRSYLALSKIKEALYAAREAMKAMPQSAKALKLVGDAHASSTSGREKVCIMIVF